MSDGFIIIDRNVFTDDLVGIHTGDNFRMYMHLLQKSVYKEITYNGQQLKPGQLMTSLRQLEDRTEITKKRWERFIKNAVSEGYLKTETVGRRSGTIITVCKYLIFGDYATYLGIEKGDSQGTLKKQVTKKQINNNKNTREKVLTKEFFSECLDRFGWSEEKVVDLYDDLINYETSKGKKYVDHKATLRTWIKKREREKPKEKKQPFGWNYGK